MTEVELCLHARAWLTNSAWLLGRTPEAPAAELVDTMLRSIILRDMRLAADQAPVAAESMSHQGCNGGGQRLTHPRAVAELLGAA